MDDRWMVGATVSRLLIPESEIIFLLVSLRLFHMRAPAPCRLIPQSTLTAEPASLWHLTGRVRDNKKKESPSIISSAQYKGCFLLSKGISWGYNRNYKDGWMSGEARPMETNGKWKLVEIKDCHSLYWDHQIWPIEDMTDVIKQSKEKKCEDTPGQKGKWRELMWLLYPSVTSSSHMKM